MFVCAERCNLQVACDPAVNGGWVLMPQVLDDRMQEILDRDGYRSLVQSARKDCSDV